MSIAATLSLNVPAITALCVGPRGSFIFAASGLPSNPNNSYGGNPGQDGDFYIDISTGFYYGPKSTVWPTTPLFSLNNSPSAAPFVFGSSTSLIVPQYGSNTIAVSNTNSAILGGTNNALTGNNSFIIGSNITAAINGFTIVNNLTSTGDIYAALGNSNQWSSTYTVVSSNSAAWSSSYASATAAAVQSQALYTAVSPNSANWNNTYTSVTANSANWNSAYNVTNGLAYITYTFVPANSSIIPTRGTNVATGSSSNVNGGVFNSATGNFSSVLGGSYNTASGKYSSVTGGYSGRATNSLAYVGGGSFNTASGYASNVVGGRNNVASSDYTVVAGGLCNIASGAYSFVAGGSANDTKGFANTFILGTGLSAVSANFTYINNLRSQNNVIINNNLGIGTTLPQTQLHINSANYGAIQLGNNVNGEGFTITKETDNSFNIWTNLIGSGTNRFKIDQSGNIAAAVNGGNVGIGIATATQRLHVNGGNILVQRGGVSTGGAVFYGSYNQYVYGDAASGQLQFGTSDTERVRIDVSGNVGIGTIAPATKLQVAGEANFLTVSETKVTPTITSNTLTLDLSTGTLFYISLNANINTLTLSNAPASPRVYSFTLQFVGDGTQRTITWPASVKWQSGTAPTPTATSTKVDTYVLFTHDGGTTYFAFIAGQNA